MTACIPDEPTWCFAPVSDTDGEPPQISIFVEGLGFAVPTALVCLTAEDGLLVADRLNRALGLDRAAWTSLAARCLRAAGPASAPLH
ncbi:MAG: hypothetical protein OXB97_05130 [Rhodospirillales bacterium]|nr:hypothetical protein [Rhodospirillales bacterium]